jgi:hypothetical protein
MGVDHAAINEQATPPGMNSRSKSSLFWISIAAAVAAVASAAMGEVDESISSKVSSDYVRTVLPDGSFKPETYTFGKGGYWSSPLNDTSIDKMDFMDVLRAIAYPLAKRNYVPSKDPKQIKLLIMVYWGTTHAIEKASDSMAYQDASRTNQEFNMAQSRDKWAAEERQHASNSGGANAAITNGIVNADEEITNLLESELIVNLATIKTENDKRLLEDKRIAMLLGYESWWNSTMSAPDASVLGKRRTDMLDELEHYRYFVVLMAYDYQLMAKEKKHKLLWEARFSIQQLKNQFNRQLPSMVLVASQYFGRDSKGLARQPLPTGRVEVKPPTLIELMGDKQ